MRRKLVILTILVLATAYFFVSTTLAHTPSPPICNDSICNIDIHDNFFEPNNVTIRPPHPDTGESVTIIWVNHGSLTHTVTIGARGSANPVFDSGNLAPGATFELTVNQTIYSQLIQKYSSSVPYHCKIHSGMDATLNITGEPIPEYSLPASLLTLALASVALWTMLVRHRKPTKDALQSN
ncbi:hypothetical protein HXY32_03260 [Candidatus Bathyarchaeota archaeon]|nr:hypothetical protein [Candidatus Bathyarchaeota archaeon]